MQQVVIENPVINSPFEEPKRHFRFSDDGITNEIIGTRRINHLYCQFPENYQPGILNNPTINIPPSRSIFILVNHEPPVCVNAQAGEPLNLNSYVL